MQSYNGFYEQFVDQSTLIVWNKQRKIDSTWNSTLRISLWSLCWGRTSKDNPHITVLLFENKLWQSSTWSNDKSSKSNTDKNSFKRKKRPNIRDTTKSCPKKILWRTTKHRNNVSLKDFAFLISTVRWNENTNIIDWHGFRWEFHRPMGILCMDKMLFV